jgi:hypothetical protein
MKQTSTELSLLESALVAIEKVLAHADSDLQGTPYLGPTTNMPLELLDRTLPNDEERVRGSAAQSAISICLSSAAALVDVSQMLMAGREDRSATEIERDWHALVAHTKIASRSAYRAAQIMAAQISLMQSQRGAIAAPAAEAPSLAH